MAPEKILLCEDFSKHAQGARQWALDYAKASGSTVVVVHVIGAWPIHAYKGKVPIDEHKTMQSIREPVNVDLELIAGELRKEGVDVITHTRIGTPVEEIIRVATEESVGLIVMGTHGWTGFRHMVLGSVAENVLKTAPCSVIVVRTPSLQTKTN